MDNINLSKEELQKRVREFQNDPHLKVINSAIAKIYETALPEKIIAGKDGSIEYVYRDEVNELIAEYEAKRDEYIRDKYSDIIDT